MREALLDANVLLHYLTDEPREQADQVAAILEAAQARHVSLVVTPLTLAEVVFVLESVYQWDRNVIAGRLLELISASVLHIFETDILAQALSWYRDIRALHVADAYVAAVASDRGHGTVISFDRGLRREPELTLINDAEALRTGG